VLAKHAVKEAAGKPEEAAKLRADAEKAAAKADAMAKLLTLVAIGAAVQPPKPREPQDELRYGVRARE
jgi:hypothetical protein